MVEIEEKPCLKSFQDARRYYLSNKNINPKDKIEFSGIDLNQEKYRDLLRKVINEGVDKEEFFKILKKFDDKFGEIIKNLQKDMLFKFTRVARFNFDFDKFSALVEIFGAWNEHYNRAYDKPGFFKNLILKRKAGENYPIECAEDLKTKFNVFQKYTEYNMFSYLDIFDRAARDFNYDRITQEKFVNIIYLIIKCTSDKFDYEICKRARDVFKEKKNYSRASMFSRLMTNF